MVHIQPRDGFYDMTWKYPWLSGKGAAVSDNMIPDSIAEHQKRWTAFWHETPPAVTAGGFLRLVEENHLHNFLLWHEEDIARRDDLPPERIVQAKRAIDRHNQQRNDCIERMDAALMSSLPSMPAEAPLHSETPGMIIDRLSILALKEYHMREESERPTATETHRTAAAAKLARVRHQRADLAGCLLTLMDDFHAGRRRFALYRQFKMYNDPALNPQLFGGGE